MIINFNDIDQVTANSFAISAIVHNEEVLWKENDPTPPPPIGKQVKIGCFNGAKLNTYTFDESEVGHVFNILSVDESGTRKIHGVYSSKLGTDDPNDIISINDNDGCFTSISCTPGFPIFNLFHNISFIQMNGLSDLVDNACVYCKKLDTAIFKNLRVIGYSAFAGCTSLSSFDLSNVYELGAQAFQYTPIRDIDIPHISALDHVFSYCSELSGVHQSDQLLVVDGAFVDCTHLSTVNISNALSVTNYALARTSISMIDLPYATTIGDGVFSDCSNLTSVNIPHVTEFGNRAFGGNCAVLALNAPSLQSFMCNSLINNDNMLSLVLSAQDFMLPIDTLYANFMGKNVNFYVKNDAKLFNEYISSSGWKTLSSRIHPYTHEILHSVVNYVGDNQYPRTITVNACYPLDGVSIEYSFDNTTWQTTCPAVTTVGHTDIYVRLSAPGHATVYSSGYVELFEYDPTVSYSEVVPIGTAQYGGIHEYNDHHSLWWES